MKGGWRGVAPLSLLRDEVEQVDDFLPAPLRRRGVAAQERHGNPLHAPSTTRPQSRHIARFGGGLGCGYGVQFAHKMRYLPGHQDLHGLEDLVGAVGVGRVAGAHEVVEKRVQDQLAERQARCRTKGGQPAARVRFGAQSLGERRSPFG